MAHLHFSAHIGLWLRPEQRIIHSTPRPASPATRCLRYEDGLEAAEIC